MPDLIVESDHDRVHPAVGMAGQGDADRLVARVGQDVPVRPRSRHAGGGLFVVPDLIVESDHDRVHPAVGMAGQGDADRLVARVGQDVPVRPRADTPAEVCPLCQT